MSYKVMKIHPAPIYTAEFARKVGHENMVYSDYMDIYNRENIVLPGDFTGHLKKEGFNVFDVLYPDNFSMFTWAAENRLRGLLSPHGHLSILLEMVKKYKPDIILIYAGGLFHIDKPKRDQIRACHPDVKIVGYWADELHPGIGNYSDYFGDLDFVLTGSEIYSAKFKEAGIPCEKFGNSYAEISYEPAKTKDIDLLFCGSSGYLTPEHTRRYEYLNRLVEDFPQIQIYSRIPKGPPLSWGQTWVSRLIRHTPLNVIRAMWYAARLMKRQRLMNLLGRIKTIKSSFINIDMLLLRHGNPDVYRCINAPKPDKLYKMASKNPTVYEKGMFWHIKGSDYYRLLSRAKIIINIARDEDADVGNIRCFEATGLGSLLITDNRPGMETLFENGKECVLYNDYDDMKAKIQYYLTHDQEREEISRRGQLRTLRDHTIRAKMPVVTRVFNSLMTTRTVKRAKVLHGIYNGNNNPISFDIMFFLEALKIKKRLGGYEKAIAQIIPPYNLQKQPGLPDEAQNIFNQTDELRFRIDHILGQVLQTEKDMDVVINRDNRNYLKFSAAEAKIDRYPVQPVHHAEFYKVVNSNPHLVTGPSASLKAKDVVDNWLSSKNIDPKRLYTITIRNYEVFPERNSNVAAWAEVSRTLTENGYHVVVVPDLSNIAKMQQDFPGAWMFELGSVDFDLRLGLYEAAHLNLFVNNGPCAAAALSPKISYLMFNIMVENSVTTDPEFLKSKGFTVGANPPYARGRQKWVWKSDSYRNIMHEIEMIEQSPDAGFAEEDQFQARISA